MRKRLREEAQRNDGADAPWPMACASPAGRCGASRPSPSASTRRPARATSRRALNGVAHLFEHMVFKGAGGRSAREISEAVEDVGGDLNASTDRELTAFYASLLAPDLAARRRAARRLGPPPAFRVRSISSSRRRWCCRNWPKRTTRASDLVFDHLQEAAFAEPAARPARCSERGRNHPRDRDGGRSARLACATQYAPSALVLVGGGQARASSDWSTLPRLRSATCRRLRRSQPSRRLSPAAAASSGAKGEQAHIAIAMLRAAVGRRRRLCLAIVRRRRSAAGRRRDCSSSCARSRAWLIRSAAGAQNFAECGLFWSYVAATAPTPGWSIARSSGCSPKPRRGLEQREVERARGAGQGGHDDEPRKLLGAGELSRRRGCCATAD